MRTINLCAIVNFIIVCFRDCADAEMKAIDKVKKRYLEILVNVMTMNHILSINKREVDNDDAKRLGPHVKEV